MKILEEKGLGRCYTLKKIKINKRKEICKILKIVKKETMTIINELQLTLEMRKISRSLESTFFGEEIKRD